MKATQKPHTTDTHKITQSKAKQTNAYEQETQPKPPLPNQPQALRSGLLWLSLAWLVFFACDDESDCVDGIKRSDYNTSGLRCTASCDCSNLKFEGYCINSVCLSNPRSPAQRKGEYRPCKLLQKIGTCEWGQQEAQPAPLNELLWGDCKIGQIGPSFPENTKERCIDGIDNDCDGRVDLGDIKCKSFCLPEQTAPCYTSGNNTLNVGICRAGIKTCRGDNLWGECVGEKKPTPEVCNKLDDNCDGHIDEGLHGCIKQTCPENAVRPCYTEAIGCLPETTLQGTTRFRCKGVCSNGIQTCRNENWSTCEQASTPTTEECDQLDNNCNGHIDEGCLCEEGKTQPCYPTKELKNVGECKAGKQLCTNGVWGTCLGSVEPTSEVCDAKDNDCNGQIDDHCACAKNSDCSQGSVCVAGVCQDYSSCPIGRVSCGADCVDLQTSSVHCGLCNKACLGGKTCRSGVCVCPTSQTNCSETCVDLASDQKHCGNCGIDCSSQEMCLSGRCSLQPQVRVGLNRTCYLSTKGEVRCWGVNNIGQLGYGDQTQRTKPDIKPINFGIGRTVKFIAVGANHNCAILDDNTVRCWGDNTEGQLGYKDLVPRKSPDTKPLDFGSGRFATVIACATQHTCVILNDGAVVCWGKNNVGELGYGDTNPRRSPPSTSVNLGAGRTAKSISVSNGHTCAQLDDNTVKCWGYNDKGQLGYGDTRQRNAPESTPVNLWNGHTATAISSRYAHTCALLNNGTAKCWGNNQYGQLGYSDTTQKNEPVANSINFGDGQTVKSIMAASLHTCAILADDTVRCWGDNRSGQLGYGNTSQKNEPSSIAVNLGIGRTAKSITTGYHVCAILDNDTVKCWGQNTYGELGYGDTTPRLAPDAQSIPLP